MKPSSFNELFASAENAVEYVADSGALDFCIALERLMKRRGVSKAELARRTGVSGAYISKVFRGDENLTIETMAKLVTAVAGRLSIEVRAREDRAIVYGHLEPARTQVHFNIRAFEPNRHLFEIANYNADRELVAA